MNSANPSSGAGLDRLASFSVVVIAVLAMLYTAYVARVVLIPLVVAVLLHVLFAPPVRRLRRIGIPTVLSSSVILLALLGGLYFAGSSLIDPAREWLSEAPTSLRQLGRQFEEVKRPLEEVKELGEEVGEMTKLESKPSTTQKVEIQAPNTFDQFFESIPRFLTSVAITFLIAFFLLSSGDRLALGIIGLGRSWYAKAQIIRVCRQIQVDVSRHLRTITLINTGLGLAVGLALHLLDVPNPALWGTMVAVLNFAPYVGVIASALVLTVVGVTTSASVAEALMVPGVFIVLTSLEGGVITPLVLGRSLKLSPVVVFIAVIFWGWMWGIIGALIAVPVIAIIKVILAHTDGGQPIARLLGR